MSQVEMKAVLLGALLTLATPGSPAGGKEHWRSVRGGELQKLFQDKEFADGVHFAYQFKADRTFTGTEMGERASGSWRVRRDEFCWKWLRPPGAEECYAVQQDGPRVRLLSNGSEAWYGTLQDLP
jgi:hypothetical protein